MQSKTVYGGIEAGGTGFSLAIAIGEPSNITERISVPTTTPQETKDRVLQWFKERGEIHSFGIASFGPVDLDKLSPTYGYITTTPKPGWQNTNILGWIKEQYPNTPVGFDTDVNGAAISETKHGKHERGAIDSCAYITVGTGIGVGVVINNQPVHGLVHPEGGHTLVKMQKGDEGFQGTCPFHGNCVEGLVSTGAISKRVNLNADQIPTLSDQDPVWKVIAHYLAELCANLIMSLSPKIIVLGGGVLNRECLYPLIRQETLTILNGYIKSPYLTPENIHKYIVQSPYKSSAGLVGSLELARIELSK
ncbi:hypothetical protein DLAC_06949 [Tieghemostelium lacteum]|uniref:fructokinase n=1 Tax=Tieghemostelium lacteum TaxID=361077 RepID=A0A151ZDW0_TIELA|nr:hypothetical protein DLAC_06949 [Tieghemostelium lacteum]|eukprot:KYQ92109.1 hypothetical protein DLAC_06949 [Tieghemostelium lacteum]